MENDGGRPETNTLEPSMIAGFFLLTQAIYQRDATVPWNTWKGKSVGASRNFFLIPVFFLPEIVPKAVTMCRLVRARAVVANTAEGALSLVLLRVFPTGLVLKYLGIYN